MKILIINQHSGNHGDEAAGKELLRAILGLNNIVANDITILYNCSSVLEEEKINTKANSIIGRKEMTLIEKVFVILTFILPFSLIKFLIIKFNIDFLKQQIKVITESDKIINAPGGVNLGPYKDWIYLWRLYIALKLKKDVAIYSISFGPLPSNLVFKKASIYVLKNVKFLSLRDNRSQSLASSLGIKHIASIDTVFLNSRLGANSADTAKNIMEEKYVVFVPNQLYKWHPSFFKYNKKQMDEAYASIVAFFIEKGVKVYLLPQLFGSQNDSLYFKQFEKADNVIVIDESFSSDKQQEVVKNAMFLVGARYHSIIFAINNKTPFFALSYEHKITNTLNILCLDEYMVEIDDALMDIDKMISKLDEIFTRCENIYIDNSLAIKISENTFEQFKKYLGLT